MSDAPDRAAALRAYAEETAGCTRCPLAATRTQVVFGSGNPDADLLFVGEAPGFHEDQNGVPFVGQAGKLLDRLLAGIGLERSDIFVANVLKCRPPQNRDPQPEEIASCEPHLFRQIELIQPKLVATLGNFATKLLSGRSFGTCQDRPSASSRSPASVSTSPTFSKLSARSRCRLVLPGSDAASLWRINRLLR